MAKAVNTSTHERVLDQSADLFYAQGFAGTSIRQIASASDLQIASLYHYMSAKADVLFEISQRSLDEITTGFQAAMEDGGSPVERIRRAMVTHMQLVLSRLSWHAAMLFELRSLPPAQRESIVQMRDAYEALFDGLLTEARAAGQVVDSTPLKMQRMALLNLLNWPMMWYRPGGDMTPAEIGSHLSDVFLNGVTPPELRASE